MDSAFVSLARVLAQVDECYDEPVLVGMLLRYALEVRHTAVLR